MISPSETRFEFTQVHMGLPVRVVLYAGAPAAAHDAAQAAFARIAALDQSMSDYRPDSELAQLNARAGTWVVVSADLFTVLNRAVEIARLTDGAFDPTVAPLVALWREARRVKRLPSDQAIADARATVGWRRVELDASRSAIRIAPGTRLDLGGVAKGYILQAAVRQLDARGVTRVLLEAGGDIVVGAAPPDRAGWRIDVPVDGEFGARASALTHAALATSGATSQFVEIDGVRYSHVIDPRRGIGVTHHRIARVIAPDGATADALATAAAVAGDSPAAEFPRRFRAVLIAFADR